MLGRACEGPLATLSGLYFDCDITILPENSREGSVLWARVLEASPGGRGHSRFGEGGMSGFTSKGLLGLDRLHP